MEHKIKLNILNCSDIIQIRFAFTVWQSTLSIRRKIRIFASLKKIKDKLELVSYASSATQDSLKQNRRRKRPGLN